MISDDLCEEILNYYNKIQNNLEYVKGSSVFLLVIFFCYSLQFTVFSVYNLYFFSGISVRINGYRKR
jgi:hypothetical protein